jgi:endonuclease/exonuclease/phosphatase family metal-dependent hydrolase
LNPNSEKQVIRIVTYNVHGCKGIDWRIVPDRPLSVLRGMDADCIALQEFVDGLLPSGKRLLEHWAEELGMIGVYAPAFVRGGETFGNALLTRFDIAEQRSYELSIAGYRRRAFLEALLDTGEATVHVTVVHLGVSARERLLMASRIDALTRDISGDVQAWVGDFNEWRTSAVVTSVLRRRFRPNPALPTFPAPAPLLALDRIWVRPADCLLESSVVRSAAARRASDHLPLTATLSLPLSVTQ